MDASLFLSFLFRLIPAIVHTFGIYSLIAARYYRGRNKVQFILLFWLSVVEISLNISKIIIRMTALEYPKVTFVLQVIRSGFLVTQFCTAMVSMTIDRLFFIWQNIKYRRENALKLSEILLLGSFLLSLSVTLTLAFTHKSKTEVYATTALYVWPVVNLIIFTVFVVTYTMIKLTIRRRSKIFNPAKSKVYRGKVRRAIQVPLLIISSFILLLMTVDFLNVLRKWIGFEIPPEVRILFNIQICTAYSLDALFYIFFCRTIRRMWIRKWRSLSCCAKEKKRQDTIQRIRSKMIGTIYEECNIEKRGFGTSTVTKKLSRFSNRYLI